MKRCTKCGAEKPHSEYAKHKIGRDGLRSRCKSCTATDNAAYRSRTAEQRAAYNKAYRAQHREEHNAYNREWSRRNRTAAGRATRQWRGKNPETVKASKRAWRLANPEKVREHKRAEYERHRDAIVQRVAAWREANRDKHRAQSLRRRALQRAADGATYTTAAHIRARFDLYGGRCFYCGATATSIDHRIPLARGGSHWPANLVPACRSCNSKKHAKHPKDMLVAA